MSSSLLVDPSAAVAIDRSEPERDGAFRVIQAAAADGLDIVVPELFWIELANTFTRRYAYRVEAVVSSFREMDELSLRTIAVDRATMLLGVERAIEHRLSVHDATYLALAETLPATLLTVDLELATAATAVGILVEPTPPRPHRLSEAPARYRSDPGAVWARHSAYLAKLRAAALSD